MRKPFTICSTGDEEDKYFARVLLWGLNVSCQSIPIEKLKGLNLTAKILGRATEAEDYESILPMS